MNQPIRQNLGTRLIYGTKNLLLADYFNILATQTVPVPANISSGIFLLDFERTLQEIVEGQAKLSSETFNSLMSIIVKTYGLIEDMDLAEQLMAAGMKVAKTRKDETDQDAILRMISSIKERVSRSLTDAGFSGAIVSTMWREDFQNFSFKEFADVKYSDVANVVKLAQEFHAQFAIGTRGDILAERLHNYATTEGVLSATRALIKTFHSAEGSYVPCRESYVMDKLFKDVFGSPLVDKESLVEGRFYNVTSVNIADISFADAIANYMWCLNISMGIDIALGDKDSSLKIGDIIKEMVTGVGTVMPFVPTEAGKPNTKRAGDHFSRIYVMHLMHRICRDDAGAYMNQVLNAIKSNKYFRLDEMEIEFKAGLRTLSMAYSAFIDTAAYYRELFRRDDLKFTDYLSLHPKRRRQLVRFIDKMFADLNVPMQSLEHPAFYKSAYPVISAPNSIFSSPSMTPDYVIDRDELIKGSSIMLVPEKGIGVAGTPVLRMFTSGLDPRSASWFEMLREISEIGVPFSVVPNANVVNPIFYFTVSTDSSILQSDLVRAQLSFRSFTDVQEIAAINPVIADYVRANSVVFYPTSLEDFAERFRMPLKLVQAIMKKQKIGVKDGWYDLSSLEGIHFFASADILQIYEIKEFEDDLRLLPPFIGKYPLLLKATNASYDMTQMFLDHENYVPDPARKDNKGRKPNPGKKTSGKNPKDTDVEESEDENETV